MGVFHGRDGRSPLGGGLAVWLVAASVAAGGCAARKADTAVPPAPAAPASQVALAPPAAGRDGVRASAPRPPLPPPLVGHVTRADLEEYSTWKDLRAQDYVPDPAAVGTIRERGAGVEVLAIVATWCPDSKRDVPRFFKIADQVGLPPEKVTLVAVDRTKRDAGGLTEKHAVSRVPTFVFLRDGQEIGRVTERPAATLEKDIAGILSK